MASRKLKHAEVAQVREAIRAKQGRACPLCEEPLPAANACLDHDHVTGHIRGALCRNCNGIEGKINNLIRRAKKKLTPAKWLDNLRAYRVHHETSQHKLIHPTHKTEAEKRDARNAKARAKRAALRKGKT